MILLARAYLKILWETEEKWILNLIFKLKDTIMFCHQISFFRVSELFIFGLTLLIVDCFVASSLAYPLKFKYLAGIWLTVVIIILPKMKLFVDILKWLITKMQPRTFKNQILQRAAWSRWTKIIYVTQKDIFYLIPGVN